jgi:hypothetical protein
MAFKLITFMPGQILNENQGAATTQFVEGDALELTEGIFTQVNAQTDKPTHIFKSMIPLNSVMRPVTQDLTTTGGELLEAIPCAGNNLEFESELEGAGAVPPINGTAVNSGSTTTALVTAAGITGDYDGGVIYFVEKDQHRKITDDTALAGVHTFTFAPALSTAASATDTVRVVPYGIGGSPKLNATTPATKISSTVADKTGGNLIVTGIDLKNYRVRLLFKDI